MVRSGQRSAGSVRRPRRLERVAQQHRDRHRADATRDGVIRPATSTADSNSTSPTNPSSVRLMPTSITVAPGLSQSPGSSAGDPPRRSAHRAPDTTQVPRPRWQIVAVACSASSSAATGLPTRSERPTTTASAPSNEHRDGGAAPSRRPGCRAAVRASPWQQAGRRRREPVDILGPDRSKWSGTGRRSGPEWAAGAGSRTRAGPRPTRRSAARPRPRGSPAERL